MYKFSRQSKNKLYTCDGRLINICEQAIKLIDFSVIFGYRSPAKQLELFKQGRDEDFNIIDKSKIVTYCDGINKKSNHNYKPSRAMDIIPYPIDWDDTARFKELAYIVLDIAENNDIKLHWGGNWKWKDYPHFELDKEYFI